MASPQSNIIKDMSVWNLQWKWQHTVVPQQRPCLCLSTYLPTIHSAPHGSALNARQATDKDNIGCLVCVPLWKPTEGNSHVRGKSQIKKLFCPMECWVDLSSSFIEGCVNDHGWGMALCLTLGHEIIKERHGGQGAPLFTVGGRDGVYLRGGTGGTEWCHTFVMSDWLLCWTLCVYESTFSY